MNPPLLLNTLLLISSLLLSVISYAEIYSWTDASGQVHFGDMPADVENAEIIEVKINSYEHVTIEPFEYFHSGSDIDQVIMYSTSWCGYCKKARNYFNLNNIPYVDYDIENNKQAKSEYDAIGGSGVPVILIGDRRMNGFSAARFVQLYDR